MSVKTFKKGEVIYKDGDKITAVYLIQSGGASQCLIRGKKNIDLFQLGSSHILGDQVILGASTHPTAAIATTETKVLEIPVEALKSHYEGAPQMLKVIIKSLADRLRLAMNDVRSSKLEKDSSPCPEDQVAKAFGAVFHTANHKGDRSTPGRVVVEWGMMKQYSQRIFAEGPKRVEQVINILVKLKLAFYEMGKAPDNPEGPDEIQRVHFLDLGLLESFFEFYQYYYFKGGRMELLKVDELCQTMLDALLKLADGQEADRFGIVSVDFAKFGEHCKNELGINLNNDHFARLEGKGVFMKRKNSGTGVLLQFEIKEFRSILQSWKMLREIEKWNEKGFVDMDEKEEKPKKRSSGPSCPACSAELQAGVKFCSECGHKIVAAA
ncbi:cyclic nucleotide-binding domain-containing protein [Bdellovibrio svalbardensis]|uniref:Cyclic nucleotide-binding domain-containing protein n=1 Tax=Bdellovibrio svalbardensis TaxID=2972972 RepID=A0ABT6DPW5_9BACT|nr:cyclic nucleotide-binding domain-containing protein [Bdellovibrio svalbardensis]MDG0818090.1 cyclic nucleotide-binding domain-containing protein [Bdellovibrio svalbardensis]